MLKQIGNVRTQSVFYECSHAGVVSQFQFNRHARMSRCTGCAAIWHSVRAAFKKRNRTAEFLSGIPACPPEAGLRQAGMDRFPPKTCGNDVCGLIKFQIETLPPFAVRSKKIHSA